VNQRPIFCRASNWLVVDFVGHFRGFGDPVTEIQIIQPRVVPGFGNLPQAPHGRPKAGVVAGLDS